MTLNLSYNDDLSRVQIALSNLPLGSVIVERSTNELYWRTVRGGAAVPITTGAASLDDYEFTADTENFYRITQLTQEENVDVFTASGTWNKPSGLVAARITVVGGGGAGGGAGATIAGQYSAGEGGGAGGIAVSVIDAASLGASETVTVGAGGTGASGAAGAAGGTSSFGTHVIASGGGGGSLTAAGTSNAIGIGPLGGTGSTGQILGAGAPGGQSMTLTGVSIARGGQGGSGPFGGGGRGSSGASGSAAVGRGSGGGGGGNSPSQVARTGGAGAGGLVFIEHIFAG
jgi:hypothetical protein